VIVPRTRLSSCRPAPVADVRYLDGTSFRTLRIPVTKGAVFDASDASGGPPRAVITESLARELWGAGNPIGRSPKVELFGGITPTIIGVVADVHLMDARTPSRPALFLSAS